MSTLESIAADAEQARAADIDPTAGLMEGHDFTDELRDALEEALLPLGLDYIDTDPGEITLGGLPVPLLADLYTPKDFCCVDYYQRPDAMQLRTAIAEALEHAAAKLRAPCGEFPVRQTREGYDVVLGNGRVLRLITREMAEHMAEKLRSGEYKTLQGWRTEPEEK